MNKAVFGPFRFVILLLVLVSLACASAIPPTPTPAATATSTLVPATATPTKPPTSTPRPTATPNLAATKEAEARQGVLQSYLDSGYIGTTTGQFTEIKDFHQEWAQLFWYQWWPISSKGQFTQGDMVFQGHFESATASVTPEISGCGIIFGLQPNKDHYAVFIDRSRIAFMMARGGEVYQVGKTSGSGRLSLTEPIAADVAVIVKGHSSYVQVNGQTTEYTLSMDQTAAGEFALSLLSGTNKDYGTKCNITHASLWMPSK